MKLTFADGIYFVLIFFFLLTGILLFIKSKSQGSSIFLGIILLLFGYAVFCRFLENSGYILHFPHFIETDFALFFLTPSLFLLYTKSYALNEYISKKTILVHSIPFLCALLFLLPVFFMNTAEKINYIKTETTSSFSWRYLVLNTSFFIYSVTYLIYILHLLNKQVKRSNETLLETKKEIKWVKILATCLLSIQVIALFLLLSSDKEKKFNYLPGFLIITLAVLIIKWVLEPDALKSLIKSKPKNPVKVSDIEKHALRLEELMKKEKPYINKELTIKMLAEMLSLPGYQLSIIINNYFNKSFFDYVNNYRVEYAKEKLLDKNFDHYKVDVIGEEVGFKSRSTFFASFKKQTSMAPIEFRKKTKSLNN